MDNDHDDKDDSYDHYMDVSKNRGVYPNSSILIGFGTYFWVNTHMDWNASYFHG